MNYENLVLNNTNEYYFVRCKNKEERVKALEELRNLGYRSAGGGEVTDLSSNDLAIGAINRNRKILYTGFFSGDKRIDYYEGMFTVKKVDYETLLI